MGGQNLPSIYNNTLLQTKDATSCGLSLTESAYRPIRNHAIVWEVFYQLEHWKALQILQYGYENSCTDLLKNQLQKV